MAAVCLFGQGAKEGTSLLPIVAAGAEHGFRETKMRRTARSTDLGVSRSVLTTSVDGTVSGRQGFGFPRDK
jgi:hypothetical protein